MIDSVIPHPDAEKQFWVFKPSRSAKFRLFCFPYAGGSALVFRNWPNILPEQIETWAVQLPGRGNRLNERPYTDIKPLVESICQSLLSYLDLPFAFFGHSLGALICYEVACYLRRQGARIPSSLFVAGRRAPHIDDGKTIYHLLPEQELIDQLRKLKGTPREIFDSPELLQLMLPVIRADFEIAANYTHANDAPLDCSIIAFGGLEDCEEKREYLEGWRAHTTGKFSLRILPGDHFFLHTSEMSLLKAMTQDLLPFIWPSIP